MWWGVEEQSAERIAHLFSSMCLVKTPIQKNDEGKKEVGVSIHDLHHDFCVEQANDECDKKK